MENSICEVCKGAFVPNKYSPRQKICSNPDCQRKRQLESMRQWRERNPDYFKYNDTKGIGWLETQRQRSKLWREKNPDKVRAYRSTHMDEYRDYMRGYMRSYREKKNTLQGPLPPVEPPTATPDMPPAPENS